MNEMTAKILVSMQHEDESKLVGDCLEHVGHDVTHATTFLNAMACMRNAEFDLIIADVHLQNGGSVFDFLRWVKGDPHTRELPFVCFSAKPLEIVSYLQDGVRTTASSLGAAKSITMEHFDGPLLLNEIQWLLPEEDAGNYYHGHHDEEGNGQKKKTKLIIKKPKKDK